MTPVYDLTVRSEEPIPEDVLVEHVAVALRDLHFTGKIGITVSKTPGSWDHPFDGPEVFDDFPPPPVRDDKVHVDAVTGKLTPESDRSLRALNKFAEGGYTGTHIDGVFSTDALEEIAKITYRPGEHRTGRNRSAPEDPYPLTTEAAMQLKEARDEPRAPEAG